MPVVKIKFPLICVEEKEIEVTQEKFESLVEDGNGITEFIWENMTEQEKTWTQGEKWVGSFVDCGFGGVTDAKKS